MTDEKLSNDDHYAILNCSPEASYETLKQSYQELIRKHHPDRSGTESHDYFLKVQQAWETLRDALSRNQYNAEMESKKDEDNVVIYAELRKKDIDLFSENIFNYPCRCGSSFAIHRNNLLEEDECLIECDECSNCILLK